MSSAARGQSERYEACEDALHGLLGANVLQVLFDLGHAVVFLKMHAVGDHQRGRALDAVLAAQVRVDMKEHRIQSFRQSRNITNSIRMWSYGLRRGFSAMIIPSG